MTRSIPAWRWRRNWVVACAGLVLACAAAAQTWPDKPIKLVVPYPPAA